MTRNIFLNESDKGFEINTVKYTIIFRLKITWICYILNDNGFTDGKISYTIDLLIGPLLLRAQKCDANISTTQIFLTKMDTLS
jgi:hypothetical protein